MALVSGFLVKIEPHLIFIIAIICLIGSVVVSVTSGVCN